MKFLAPNQWRLYGETLLEGVRGISYDCQLSTNTIHRELLFFKHCWRHDDNIGDKTLSLLNAKETLFSGSVFTSTASKRGLVVTSFKRWFLVTKTGALGRADTILSKYASSNTTSTFAGGVNNVKL